jgi:uncharacterized protein
LNRKALLRLLSLDVHASVLMQPSVQLPGVGRVPLLAPRPEHIVPETLALAVSRAGRYANLGQRFLSVAEHSWIVSHLCPEAPLQALLHDLTEAVLGDMAAPIKKLLRLLELSDESWFDILEDCWWQAIATRFGVPYEMHPRIDVVDGALRVVEQHVLFPGCEHLFDPVPGIGPNWLAKESERLGLQEPIVVRCLPPGLAYERFMLRLYELGPKDEGWQKPWPAHGPGPESAASLGGA